MKLAHIARHPTTAALDLLASAAWGEKCRLAWLGLFSLCLLTPEARAVDYLLEEQLNARLERAEQGDVQAQYAVGDMYFKGRGTLVDL